MSALDSLPCFVDCDHDGCLWLCVLPDGHDGQHDCTSHTEAHQ